MRRAVKQQVVWPFVVYVAQIPVLVTYVLGVIPIHPIATVMPLVVLLNARIDRRGPEGLGVRAPVRPGWSLLLIGVFAGVGLAGELAALWLEGIALRAPTLTMDTVGSLARDLAVDVLIIALWEEIVSRGYIQTRLQEAWGFRGVLVATLLFASLHLPSAVDEHGWAWATLFRLSQVGFGGLILGLAYWWTRSVPVTIALHGLRNFLTLSLMVHLSGVAGVEIQASQMGFKLFWLLGQVGLMIVLGRVLFGRGSPTIRQPESLVPDGWMGERDPETVG